VDAFDAAALGLPLIQLSVVTVNVHESRNAFPDQFWHIDEDTLLYKE
jgi:hypothetical protein